MILHSITEELGKVLNRHLVSRRVLLNNSGTPFRCYRKIRYELYEIQDGLPILMLESESGYINYTDAVEAAKTEDRFESEFLVKIMKLYAKQLSD